MWLDTWREYGLLVDGLSGLLYVALGIFMLTVRPRRALNVAFAAFAIAFGGSYVAANPQPLLGIDFTLTDGALTPLDVVVTTLRLIAAGGLVAAALLFPRPLRQGERKLAWGAGIVAALGAASLFGSSFVYHRLVEPYTADAWWSEIGTEGLYFSSWLALFLFAARWRESSSPLERHQLALVSAALIPYIALDSGDTAAYAVFGDYVLLDWIWVGTFLAVLLALAAAWLRNTATVAPPASSFPRTIAIMIVGLALAGMACSIAVISAWGVEDAAPADLGFLGLARTAGVAVLAYAILKHQLFDIDLRVKRGLQNSTIAGVFVAVFFVASEAAQRVFETRAGPIVGIIATGLMVFALAPLQRTAETLANRAMPHTRAHEVDMTQRKRDTYRGALALAWEDGTLSPKEMKHLMDLRGALGLPATEYDAIEREFHV